MSHPTAWCGFKVYLVLKHVPGDSRMFFTHGKLKSNSQTSNREADGFLPTGESLQEASCFCLCWSAQVHQRAVDVCPRLLQL